jgi:hypothetical protein
MMLVLSSYQSSSYSIIADEDSIYEKKNYYNFLNLVECIGTNNLDSATPSCKLAVFEDVLSKYGIRGTKPVILTEGSLTTIKNDFQSLIGSRFIDKLISRPLPKDILGLKNHIEWLDADEVENISNLLKIYADPLEDLLGFDHRIQSIIYWLRSASKVNMGLVGCLDWMPDLDA